MRVMKFVVSWILPLVVDLLFVAVGVGKFVDPSWRTNFARWGYPEHFYMATGLIEAAGGLALFVPKLRFFAALTLGAVMLAAVLTAAVHREPHFAWVASVYFVMVAAIAWTRRPALTRFWAR